MTLQMIFRTKLGDSSGTVADPRGAWTMPKRGGTASIRELVLAVVCSACWSSPAVADDLIAYWNFNNIDAVFSADSNFQLGQWRSDPDAFGEAFDASLHRISANTEFGVFHGENIYVDLSGISGKLGEGGDSKTRWGAFTDTKVNREKTDLSTGGSLMVSPGMSGDCITFVVSTRGYHKLTASLASRANVDKSSSLLATDTARFDWSGSTDGQHFTPIDAAAPTPTFGKQTINISADGGQGLTQFDDQPTVYLRATFNFPEPRGNLSLDNFQLRGIPK